MDATKERFDIALSGHEPGHLAFDTSGRLMQITERETPPKGAVEATKRPITPESPWSRQLMMDSQGRWFVLEPITQAEVPRHDRARGT